MADAPAEEPAAKKPEPPAAPSRVGKFIQTYHTFLSTFVIGAAGLIATSIWQYKQSEIARHQADSQQAIAKTQAENQWRIERAEILSKNLQVLAARGGQSVDQRYGVLLSLTRGEILDPELAVSYALELGKDNPEYMKSVLASTAEKDYVQLAHSFSPTCDQRYGLSRQVDMCKIDEVGPRSDAIAHVVSDEAEAWATSPPAAADAAVSARSPMALLRDERAVQKEPTRLVWLFAPAIIDLYQHAQWAELKRFEGFSVGAHAIVALLIALARTEELRTSAESGDVDKLHADESKWLADYLLGKTCDDECRGRFVEVMLTGFADAKGDFDEPMRRILERPTVDSGPSVARLHGRMTRCQVEVSNEQALRDRVLVPLVSRALDKPKSDPAVLDNLLDLLALVPEPTEPTSLAPWTVVLARLQKASPDKYRKGYVDRRASAEREKKSPPPSLRKVSFCKAADSIFEVGQEPE